MKMKLIAALITTYTFELKKSQIRQNTTTKFDGAQRT